jgi:UDP-N-acetylglucosamine acyltransferase
VAIHPTAVVHPTADLGPDVELGPYVVVGANVTIGARTSLGPHVVVEGPTTLGEDNRISGHVFLGGPPQDLKYRGEPTELILGNRNQLREFMTANRGSMTGRGKTVIGDDNLFMAYTHVAHDCIVGSRIVFANGATLAGHCTVEDDAIIGGFSAIRQFCRIGRYAYVGGFTPMSKDVLPFVWTAAERDTKAYKMNSVGLSRKGFSAERVAALQAAWRSMHRHRHDRAALVAALEEQARESEDVKVILDFILTTPPHGFHGA